MTPDERVGPRAVAVYRSGTGTERVMLVHGSMDRASSLAKVSRRLSDLAVLRYDRAGYGESVGSAPATSVEEHVEDLLAVLGGQPAVVVGHSMGGTVALATAARHPDLVRAVGAYEAPRPWIESGTARPRASAAAEGDPADAAELFMRHLLGDPAWERLPERTRQRRRAEGTALLADMFSTRSAVPYRDADIEVPVVSGHGSASNQRHIDAARELAQAVRLGEAFVIEGAEHGAHSSHPNEFTEFVRKVVAAGAGRARRI